MPPEPIPRASLLKIPRQQRAIDTVHSILDAGIHVLQRDGVIGFNTNRVAEVAGVSPGSLYQYFANKDMIIAGILERGVISTEGQVRELSRIPVGTPPRVLVRQLLTSVLLGLEPYSALLAEILSATPVLSGTGLGAVLEARLTDAARDFLEVHSERYVLRGGRAALYVTINGVVYVTLKWLSERPAFITREDLVDSFVSQLDLLLVERA